RSGIKGRSLNRILLTKPHQRPPKPPAMINPHAIGRTLPTHRIPAARVDRRAGLFAGSDPVLAARIPVGRCPRETSPGLSATGDGRSPASFFLADPGLMARPAPARAARILPTRRDTAKPRNFGLFPAHGGLPRKSLRHRSGACHAGRTSRRPHRFEQVAN